MIGLRPFTGPANERLDVLFQEGQLPEKLKELQVRDPFFEKQGQREDEADRPSTLGQLCVGFVVF